MSERVIEDVHASAPWRWRAYADSHGLGLVDAAGPTPQAARDKVRVRHRLRWLGVEWPGMAVPDEARNPQTGQVAINGHRYALWRQVGSDERLVHWIMLNPSRVNAATDDPTLRRVCDYSRRWGYGWVTVGNLWSYRATKPADLKKWSQHGGEWVVRTTAKCQRWVLSMAQRAHLVIVAWGNHGHLDRRSAAMLQQLAQHGIEPHALALTRQREPAHLLRLAARLTPRPLTELLEKDS